MSVCPAAERWDACLDTEVAVIQIDPSRHSGWYHHATKGFVMVKG